MFAIAPTATNSTALSPLPAAVLSDSVLTVNTQNHASAAASLNSGATATAQVSVSAHATFSASGGGTPSTPFLAQLLGQNASDEEDNQIGLSSTFSHFLPAPQYNQLVGYSIVKYRPSDAGLPSFYYSAAAASDDSGTGAQPVSEYSAYSTTLTRNQSNLAGFEPQILTAG